METFVELDENPPSSARFVELMTDPELYRLEREIQESNERLEELIRDAVESAAESVFGLNRAGQNWTEESNFNQFTEALTDHLISNIEGEMSSG